jgi:ABC-type uncharacterized transport system involved in gliding motility, auxiliary component
MEQTTRKRRSLVILSLSLAVIVAAVLVTDRFSFKLDFSAGGENSLARVTKQLYREIPEQVRLTYYISSTLSDRHPGPRSIETALRSVAAASHGKISVDVVDPAVGKKESVADALGMQAQRMQVVEKNEQRIALVYSGILVQYLGRTQVLPFVISTQGLEYSLVKAIKAAVSGKSYVASILVGDAGKSWQNDYQTLSQAMQKAGWEARELQKGDEVPADTSVLLVLGNSSLDDYDVYRIDQYLASGGRALFAVKGVDVETQQGLYAQPLQQDALLRALESYGVKVDRDLVLDKSMLTARFQTATASGGAQISYVPYPHWVMTRPEFRDRKSPLTARTEGLDLFWPSPLEPIARQGVTESVLIKTTPKAWLQKSRFAVAPEEAEQYAAEQGSTTGQYDLAVSLSGSLPSAYAGKALPTRQGAAALPAPIASAKESKILVIGSADFANDIMTYTESSFNATFIASASDWLASGDDLVLLKTRGNRDTRLSKLQDPESRLGAITLSYLVNIILVPAAVLVFGIVRSSRRKKLAKIEALAKAEVPAPESSGEQEGVK